jgi:acyl carrier protein
MNAERVRALIRELKGYGSAEIVDDTRLVEDLHFDSMEVMNLILRLEEELGRPFRDEHLDLQHFATFGRILATLGAYADAR